MTKNIVRTLAATAALALCAGAAQADALTVSSYDMNNGDGQAHSGTFNYWDANYTGAGPTTTDGLSGSVLTGGTGKLTDGVISTQRWDFVSNGAGTGEYVGWQNPNPATITFYFSGSVALDEVKLYVDASQYGGVYAPDAVIINGVSFANPGWTTASATETLDFSGLGITGDHVTVQLHSPVGNGGWVFLSEAQFFGTTTAVPEAGNAAMLLGGLGLLGLMARRRRA